MFLASCGTGPWDISKGKYQVYKEPIYEQTQMRLNTNGYYLGANDATEINGVPVVLVFQEDGYVTELSHTKYESFQYKDSAIEEVLGWWKVKGDSLIIEQYGETNRNSTTSVWWYRGTITKEGTIELYYQDSNYIKGPYRYRFVPDNSVPALRNTARYRTKKWYTENVHPSRKKSG
jgi:hypothetical protein